MLRAVIACLCIAAVARAAPGGRVVRVERDRAGGRVPARICEVRGDGVTCLGEEPRAGDAIVVADERRVVAKLRVTDAKPFGSRCSALWTVTADFASGDAGALDGANLFGVIDARIDESRAHRIAPDLAQSPRRGGDDSVIFALDRDGDDAADVLVTHRSCDPDPTGARTPCIDVWDRSAGRLAVASTLDLAACF